MTQTLPCMCNVWHRHWHSYVMCLCFLLPTLHSLFQSPTYTLPCTVVASFGLRNRDIQLFSACVMSDADVILDQWRTIWATPSCVTWLVHVKMFFCNFFLFYRSRQHLIWLQRGGVDRTFACKSREWTRGWGSRAAEEVEEKVGDEGRKVPLTLLHLYSSQCY